MEFNFKKNKALLFLISMILVFSFQNTYAQKKKKPKTTRILFLLDGSGSMMAKWEGQHRIDVARDILSDLIDSLATVRNLEIGLRVYGHQFHRKFRNCTDSKLEVGFTPRNHEIIKQKLAALTPQGTTPIAYSLEQATKDFPNDKNTRNVIIMITDGIESCNGDPCAISLGLQQKGIFLRPFIIGMGIEKDYAKAFQCMGRFLNAQNGAEFRRALDNVVNQTLGKTTISVELLDIDKKKTEKDVNIAFINNVTKKSAYDLVHYRDKNGKTDILDIDAIPSYDLVVYTTPPIVKKNVNIIGGKHNTIQIKTPQGLLHIKQKGSTEYSRELKAIIRKSGRGKTVFAQQVGQKERYLVGNYDIEVLTLPRAYYKNIKINQNKTTLIDVPQPGLLTVINKLEGFGSLYKINPKGNKEWIYNLSEGNYRQANITLQPGKYHFVFRTKQANGSSYTKNAYFEIRSGQSTAIDILKM